jgi:hypothetical protein
MKTFKLILLIVVLITTGWLMAEGIKVNILGQPTLVSQSSSNDQTSSGPSVSLK